LSLALLARRKLKVNVLQTRGTYMPKWLKMTLGALLLLSISMAIDWFFDPPSTKDCRDLYQRNHPRREVLGASLVHSCPRQSVIEIRFREARSKREHFQIVTFSRRVLGEWDMEKEERRIAEQPAP
jgi:hypothetical protein